MTEEIVTPSRTPSVEPLREPFRALVENLHGLLYTVDAEGRLVYANPTWEKSLGAPPDPSYGRPFVEQVHPDDREAWCTLVARTLEGHETDALEYRITDAHGHWRWHRVEGTTIAGIDGRPPLFLGAAEDITEKRLVERHTVLAQKMESIGALAGGIAHDIGNLLTPMLGFSELLREHAENRELVTEFAEVIDTNLTKLDKLTRQLLLFGRKPGVQYRPMDLRVAIAETVQALDPSIPDTVDLRVDHSPESLVLRGEPIQVQQALTHLCINALDAMPDGGVLTLATSTLEPDELFLATHPGAGDGTHVRVRVHDTGCGMDRETREKIFEPFFTTGTKGQRTGLGLAVALKVVEDLGGFIDVRSEPGRGSTFDVSLPLATLGRPD